MSTDRNYWNVARKFVAAIWDAHAVIYHGYEVVGMENLPKDGAALIVYYHGAIPIDMYYLVAKVCIEQDRSVSFSINIDRRRHNTFNPILPFMSLNIQFEHFLDCPSLKERFKTLFLFFRLVHTVGDRFLQKLPGMKENITQTIAKIYEIKKNFLQDGV